MKKLILGIIERRAIRYLISGSSAAAANLATLFILVHFLKVWYLAAAVISFLAGLLVSFIMQKFFTFRDYTRHLLPRQTALYASFHTLNLFFNTALMYVGVDILGVPYLLSQAIISLLLAIVNFFTSKHLVFNPDTPYNKDII